MFCLALCTAILSIGQSIADGSKTAHKLVALQPGDGAVKWEFTAGGKITRSWPAVASDDTVYVGSKDSNVYAIKDGQLQWKFPTNGKIKSSPAIGDDGTIYIGSGKKDHNLYAINADGSLKWKFQTAGKIGKSSPAIAADGTVYIGSKHKGSNATNSKGSKGILYAITKNGTLKWHRTFAKKVKSRPAIHTDGTIFVGVSDGKSSANFTDGKSKVYKVVALNHEDGSSKWEFVTGGKVTTSWPALASDGTVYIGSKDANIYAIKEGKLQWKVKTDGKVKSSPAVGVDDTVYIASGKKDHNLYAIEASGKLKWKYQLEGKAGKSSPAIAKDGTVYVGSKNSKKSKGKGVMHAIAQDGTLKWTHLFAKKVKSRPVIDSTGAVVFAVKDGKNQHVEMMV